MKSLTKNEQSAENIQKMAEQFFKGQKVMNYRELTEGYFNAAYLVELEDGREVVLKVAPRADIRIMTYEKNMMFSEVKAMEMAAAHEKIPIPKLFGYDDSGTICKSPYFFMEKLEGSSLNSIKDTLTATQLEKIYGRLGEINRRINEITCPCFGYPGQQEFQGESWYPTFRKMLEAGLKDARKGNVVLGVSAKELMQHLEYDRECFEEVTVPKLVHWDLWDGNVFVLDGEITGLIDWERSIFGDPLLEVGFRTYSQNKEFLRGYGIMCLPHDTGRMVIAPEAAVCEAHIMELTPVQERRALWYDVYLLLLMSSECEYRGYETLDMYEWATKMLRQQFQKIKNEE